MGKLKWLWWWRAGNGRQLREEGWSVRMINSRCPELPAERKKRILCPAGSGHPGCLFFILWVSCGRWGCLYFPGGNQKLWIKFLLWGDGFGYFWRFILLHAGAIKQYIYEYMDDGGQLKPEHCLVEILPEILGHKAERTEKGPTKCVEICIPVVRVITKTLRWSGMIQALSTTNARKRRQTKMLKKWGWSEKYLKTDIVFRTGTSPAGIATELIILHLLPPIPVRVVVVELHPRLVPLSPRTVVQFVPIREILNALLGEHAHINL